MGFCITQILEKLVCKNQFKLITRAKLTKFFIQKITSKIFTPINSSLSRQGEGAVHSSVSNCVPKLKHPKLVNS